MLSVIVASDMQLAGWTSSECISFLKAEVLTRPNTRIKVTRSRQVSAFSGAEIAFEESPSSGEPFAAWMAFCPNQYGAVQLVAFGTGETVEQLQVFYEKFVNSFRAAGSPPPTATLTIGQCVSGYDLYLDDKLGFSACYPADWVAIKGDEEGDTDRRTVVFSSPISKGEDGLIAAAVAPGVPLAEQQGIQILLDEIVESEASIVNYPRATQLDGKDAIRGAWEAKEVRDGQVVLVSTWMTLVDGPAGMWVIGVSGPSERTAVLEAINDRFVSTFHLLTNQ